ncbi:MAG: elongation factor 1-beta [Candidatus Nanoarchaeia archaeon]|nr:elongation factor 1-beta [Candidatus Nanoarchaeia archaeon]
MGKAILKIKIMPESPDSDLEKIEIKAKEVIEEENGTNLRFEIEPIAFGLNAVNVIFIRDESLDSDILTDKLKKIKQVNSAEIVDFRRAIG